MREIVFDTETTGLNANEDRIIEIGAVELLHRNLTGQTFHVYINPQGREVHPDAFKVHGISNEMLNDKASFAEIADEFCDFIEGAKLVAHNASFDIRFINAELQRLGRENIAQENVIDTLQIARRKFPMGPNSLDALCKRLAIDNSHRQLHGALLDSELLAEVYVELLGGKQKNMGFLSKKSSFEGGAQMEGNIRQNIHLPVRIRPLKPFLTDEEKVKHAEMLKEMGTHILWLKS